MATILFLTDIDEGHIYPTIGLANSLSDHGHKVFYSGILDAKEIVEGFNHHFIPVFKEVYPAGFIYEYKKIQKANWLNPTNRFPRPHLKSIINGEFDVIMQTVNPDLLIVSYHLPIEAFLLKKIYSTQMIFFTTWLRMRDTKPFLQCNKIFGELPDKLRNEISDFLNVKPENMENLFLDIDSIAEIIPCPKEFDSLYKEYDTPVYHIEPLVKTRTNEGNFFQSLDILPGSKIIYLTLGSQTALHSDWSEEFYKRFIDLMSEGRCKKWHLIMVIGKEIKKDSFATIPSNVTVLNWAPQLEILAKADLAIIHGGLGTIKESIYFGVPMMVFPIRIEQRENADRILYHNLGIILNYDEIASIDLYTNITTLISNHDIISSVQKMKAIFQEYDNLCPSNKIIEKIIDGFLL